MSGERSNDTMALSAPNDQAGGILVIGYGDGTDEHRMRIHVQKFSTTVPSGPAYNWPWVSSSTPAPGYSTPAGETGVTDTATNLLTLIAALYNSNWNFWTEAFYRNNFDGTLSPVFPAPVTTVTGSGSTADTVASRVCASIYQFNTAGGGRARLVLVGANGRVQQLPAAVSSTGGGLSSEDRPLVGYLGNTGTPHNTAVLGHDGHRLQDLAKVSVTEMAVLRRKYGYS